MPGAWHGPKDLLETMDAKLRGKNYNQEAFGKRVRNAVTEMVRRQVECGAAFFLPD
jgi:hypothetical protein